MQPRFCSKCGNALKDRDNFCRKCGASVLQMGAGAPNPPKQKKMNANIPSYNEIRSRFNRKNDSAGSPLGRHEETVLIGSSGNFARGTSNHKKGKLYLSVEDMLRGSSKVIDFGTGKRYEVEIPAGLSPGDSIIVKDTGITDRDTGVLCDIELELMIK